MSNSTPAKVLEGIKQVELWLDTLPGQKAGPSRLRGLRSVLEITFRDLASALQQTQAENQRLRAGVEGAGDRISLAGFLRRLLPHVDDKEWQRHLRDRIDQLEKALASPESAA